MTLAKFTLALVVQPCKYFQISLDFDNSPWSHRSVSSCSFLALFHAQKACIFVPFPLPTALSKTQSTFILGNLLLRYKELPHSSRLPRCRWRKKSNSLFSTNFNERSDWLCHWFRSTVHEAVVKTAEKVSWLKEINSPPQTDLPIDRNKRKPHQKELHPSRSVA
jgi:hypothetical protein